MVTPHTAMFERFVYNGGKLCGQAFRNTCNSYLVNVTRLEKPSLLMGAFSKWLRRKSLSERGSLYSADPATSHAAEQTRRSLWKMKWQGQADGEQSTCQPKCQINLSSDQVENYWNVSLRNSAPLHCKHGDSTRHFSPSKQSREQFISVHHISGWSNGPTCNNWSHKPLGVNFFDVFMWRFQVLPIFISSCIMK